MAKKQTKPGQPTIENRRARFDYEISDTLEVGIALTGAEVKSVRDSQVSLAEGYVRVQTTPPGLFLHGVTIADYGPASDRRQKSDRTRVLLAHKREVLKLIRQVDQKGMTIVPLRLYFKGAWAKLLIGVGKGRTRHDKRRAIGDRETKRDIDRVMSRRAG
ncbi:MAG: SsrA-binding protein SmpB [Phycisphaerales bacterium]